MSLDDDLVRRVSAVATDRERGATELAREALDVLCWATREGGLELLTRAADALVRARPAMAAIKNVVRRVVEEPTSMASLPGAADACRRARAWLDEASGMAVDQAVAAIQPGAVVVTCSFSSAVVRACLRAAGEHRARVIALESSVAGVAYGERVAAWLRPRGVACDVVADRLMADALEGATLVLVGADRVLAGGSLVNGTPSLRLAVTAHHHHVPFYAICEAFKLDEELLVEPGFDLIPARLVTAYITAYGVAAPSDVWAAHQRA